MKRYVHAKELGGRIRARRKELEWGQKILAVQGGISIGFLSDVENGKRNLSLLNAVRIANALGVSLEYLVHGNRRARP